MSDAVKIYREMKSFYKKDFGAYLNHISGFSYILANGMAEPSDVEETEEHIRNSLRNVKEVYDAFTPEMAGKEYFSEIRGVSEMIALLEENVEYLLENYRNDEMGDNVRSRADAIQEIASSINEKGSAWRGRINSLGKEIGIDKDIWHYK